MEQQKKTAGRKPLSATEKTVNLSARVTESQRKRFVELGGSEWLRSLINERTPSEPTAGQV